MLSHLSAAGLWELLPPLLAPVHVTVPTDGGRSRRPGIRLHRSPHLPVDATTHQHSIAVTTPARTLKDLRGVLPARKYRQAVREAAYRNLDLGHIVHDRTRSDPERDFVRLCRRHHLPGPEVNVPIGRFTVDFLWPTERLVVETDAWSSHRGDQAFEDDHERDLELEARGYRVRRFTRLQLENRPEDVVASVRRALLAGLSGHR